MVWALMRAAGVAIPVGLTPSLPLLIIAAGGYTKKVTLNSTFDWLGTFGAVLVLALWVAVDIFGDKVPAMRAGYDRVKFGLAPLAGGVAAAAVYDNADIAWPVIFVLGAVLAGAAHVVKLGVRPRLESTPVGRMFSPLVSLFTDSMVAVLAIVALVLPPASLAFGLLILAGGALARRSKAAKQT